jgi:Ser/Thr protein kinase RdoA (MazF antagonist)
MSLLAVRSIKPVNPLYRNMYDAHHKITKDAFMARVAQPDFDPVRKHMDELLKLLSEAEALASVIRASGGLPEQVINADLHFDNVLVDSDGDGWLVTGILDFEFAAFDWRIMEMVCGLSKYAGVDHPLTRFKDYIRGYAEGGGKITMAEAKLVPELIVTRILNNVVYFVGRALAGEDTIAPIIGRAAVYHKRCSFLSFHSQDIIDILKESGCIVD